MNLRELIKARGFDFLWRSHLSAVLFRWIAGVNQELRVLMTRFLSGSYYEKEF